MGIKLKYMGTSDYRVLEKGEDFGGQLAEPLKKRVVWSPQNNHLVDSEDAGLSPEACDLLLAMEGLVYGEGNTLSEDEQDQDTGKVIKEFKDVTDLKVIPPSLHQSTFLGLKGIKNKDIVEAEGGEDDTVPEPDADTSGQTSTKGEKATERAAKTRTSGGGAGSGGTAGGTTAGGGATAPVGGTTDGVGGDTTTSGTT